MTVRSIILGLLGAMFIAGFGWINDNVLRLSPLVGTYLPVSVFGLMIIIAVTANPLLYLMRPSLRLTKAELAFAIGLMLIACSVPGAGVMQSFTSSLSLPSWIARKTPGWVEKGIVQYTPPHLLAGGGQYDEEVIDNILNGSPTPGVNIGLGDVPWQKWAPPLTSWLPVVALMGVCAVSLGLIVHKQWSRHERLRYPIAEVAQSLLDQRPGKALGPLYVNKLFWMGLAVVLGVRLINGLHAWYPTSIHIPLSFDLTMIGERYPWLKQGVGSQQWMNPLFSPTMIAFAYFLASDVSFSLGISTTVYVIVTAIMISGFGMDLTTRHMDGGSRSWQEFGSFLGLAVMMLYTGRRYYLDVVRKAVGLASRSAAVERHVAIAFWVLILATAAMIGWISWLGLQWPLAIIAVLSLLLMMVVVSRITAETGFFLHHVFWQPAAVLIGLLGVETLGVKPVIIAALFSLVLTVDFRANIMPFFVNALKITDDSGVRPSRMAPAGLGVFLLALALAVPVVLWASYNYGLPKDNGWITGIPKFPYFAANNAVDRLNVADALEWSNNLGPVERLANMKPTNTFLVSTTLGFGLVLAASALRLRLPRWPIHPVVFAIWATWYIWTYSFSFLLGWGIKSAVMSLGGGNRYKSLKPLMIGVVAGDLLGGLVFMAVGAIYYWKTGLVPPRYPIFSF